MATIDELYQQSLLGNLPTTLTPYQRIMGQMTPTMNPYTGAGQAIAGYDPALFNRRSGSGLINLGSGGGMGGGMGGGDSGVGFSNPFSELTPAQQAAYYAENPTMAAITRAGQGLFGATYLGQLQNYFNPGFQAQQNVLTYGYAPELYADPGLAAAADAAAAAQQDNNVAAGLAAAADAAAAAQGGGGGYSASDYGGYSGSETQSSGESYANFKGGLIDKVAGPNPPGPDDGAGMLQLGEYVIKKSAVKKYGQGLLDMINDGKIPAKKMKSLLG